MLLIQLDLEYVENYPQIKTNDLTQMFSFIKYIFSSFEYQ